MDMVRTGACIDINRLEKDRYFMSLLQEGYHCGLISEEGMERVHFGVMAILEELIRKYTLGESSSVKAETGIDILHSVYYVLDACAASLGQPEDLFPLLQEKGLREVYQDGLVVVQSCVEESRKLYEDLYRNKLLVPLVIYNAMLEEDLPVFFKNYDIHFSAHHTVCNMDYPLVFDDMSKSGIIYIQQFLKKLMIETQFCKCFKPGNILKTLQAYGRRHRLDFRNAPVNLFEVLFDQAVFSVLSGCDEIGLPVSELDFRLMNIGLSDRTHLEVEAGIDAAKEKLIEKFQIHDKDLIQYINRYRILFAKRVMHAVDNGNLAEMVLMYESTGMKERVLFQDGKRMSDADFKQFIDDILCCTGVDEKLAVISSRVHSMEDYMDLLEADCLFEEEYGSALNHLNDLELAVLGNAVFYEEFSSGSFLLIPEMIEACKKDMQLEWHLFYADFLLGMDADRRDAISEIIPRIVNARDTI